jgi:hypothetical protein
MIEDVPNNDKHITMSMYRDGERIEISRTLDNDCSWMEIAAVFYQFLSAMSYKVDIEDVGGEF